MRMSTTLIQLQTLHVITQPLRFERYLEETGGLMTMALPFRQKAKVKNRQICTSPGYREVDRQICLSNFRRADLPSLLLSLYCN